MSGDRSAEVRMIPFPGKALEYDSSTTARLLFPAPERGFLIGPENHALEPVIQWILDERLSREQLPVLFYGTSGCGKSHLLQGIFNAWRGHRKGEGGKRRAYLLTAGDFARQLTESLDTKTTDEFRRRYRNATILLIDDLDQLADKPWAQDELQYTLDALATDGGTAVLAAGSFPGEGGRFSETLTSRLLGGTSLPILLPGVAVRKRFLAELISGFRLSLPEATLFAMLDDLPASLPALYGIVAQLYFEASAEGTQVDAATLHRLLKERRDTTRPRIDLIAKRVARHFSLKLSDLKGKSRNKTVAMVRSFAVYLVRQKTQLHLKDIAKYFGNRDPSTIRHLVERIQKDLPNDPILRDHLFRLEESF